MKLNFKNWSIFSKILAFSIFSILCFTVLIWIYIIPNIKNMIQLEKISGIKHNVGIVYNLVQDYYKKVQKGELTEEQAKADALHKIANLRYDYVYFWINDMRPYMIMHPTNPKLNGTDISTYKDPYNKYLFVEMVKVCKEKGEGMVDYYWPKPGSDKPVAKLSYVKLFEPWEWVIGNGLYVDDMDAEAKAELDRTYLLLTLISAGLVIILIVLSIVIARMISNPLKKASESAMLIAEGKIQEALKKLS